MAEFAKDNNLVFSGGYGKAYDKDGHLLREGASVWWFKLQARDANDNDFIIGTASRVDDAAAAACWAYEKGFCVCDSPQENKQVRVPPNCTECGGFMQEA